MLSTNEHRELDPVASVEPPVQVQSDTISIHELNIERPAIIAYLQKIAPDKQAIALVHALEVGVTELTARRQRFHP